MSDFDNWVMALTVSLLLVLTLGALVAMLIVLAGNLAAVGCSTRYIAVIESSAVLAFAGLVYAVKRGTER